MAFGIFSFVETIRLYIKATTTTKYAIKALIEWHDKNTLLSR